MMEKLFAGKKCDICIGCGLCGEVLSKVDVLTKHLPYLGGPCSENIAAVDIGTSTIAMQLFDKSGDLIDEYVSVNPQFVYGADVISRINACTDIKARDELREMVIGVLEKGFSSFKQILNNKFSAVIAGNTTMIYLLMGYDPLELGEAPFKVSHSGDIWTSICGVDCFIVGGFSAFVGGDIKAGMYATNMHQFKDITLLLDLGTNGEMLLGNSERIIGCATAAGPAFEGGINRGVFGSDMINCIRNLLDRNIVDETGLIVDEYFDSGIRIGNVNITNESIRAIQLAKAAIRSGIDLLCEKYGIDYTAINRVVLAGGLGYYIKPEDCVRIKLLPKELLDRTVSGGNTALLGAYVIGRDLFGTNERDKLLSKLDTSVEIINLANTDNFDSRYIDNLNF